MEPESAFEDRSPHIRYEIFRRPVPGGCIAQDRPEGSDKRSEHIRLLLRSSGDQGSQGLRRIVGWRCLPLQGQHEQRMRRCDPSPGREVRPSGSEARRLHPGERRSRGIEEGAKEDRYRQDGNARIHGRRHGHRPLRIQARRRRAGRSDRRIEEPIPSVDAER